MRRETAPAGTGDDIPAASGLTVVAVTSFRPEEVAAPAAEMDATTAVVTVDGDAGSVAKARSAARKTRRAIREHDPDLLLLDAYGTVGAPAAFVAGRHDVPVVARLVSDIWRRQSEEHLARTWAQRDVAGYASFRVSRALTSYVLSQAAGFVVVSNELRDVVARRTDTPRERIGVVPVPATETTGAVGSADRARQRFGVTEESVVLTVTNLEFAAKSRGTADALADLEPLLAGDPDLAYVVAGGGRYYEQFRGTVAETLPDPATRERVYAPGFVDGVADLYALADVFVYVSYLDGYPNAVLEAQAAGLPVVANAAHGMCDQVTDGETGLLVDGAEGEVRSAVAALLSDDERRRRLGEAARERVSRENSPRAVGRQLEAFLTRLRSDLSAR